MLAPDKAPALGSEVPAENTRSEPINVFEQGSVWRGSAASALEQILGSPNTQGWCQELKWGHRERFHGSAQVAADQAHFCRKSHCALQEEGLENEMIQENVWKMGHCFGGVSAQGAQVNF